MPSKYPNTLLAKRLENLFRLRGLKAEYVALKVGVSMSYLSKLRHGKAPNPGYMIILGLAEVFEVSPAYFFGEDDDNLPMLDEVAMRAGNLDSKARKALSGTLNNILEFLESIQEDDESEEQIDDPP